MFEPKPVQPGGPPLHIGGDAAATLRRVAKFGEGWIPMNHSAEMLPASLARLTDLWNDEGRSGRPEITVGWPVRTNDGARRAQDAGVDRLIAVPWQRSREAMDGIARFAEELIVTAR
jgi:alkanesulfonate monooxygenase SsuD/methylene tetrahydromethanopterin reductase-like flavin-dependent oxidoreductase (luciferase family)